MEPQMDADTRRERLDQTTEKIIGCCYIVISVLGSGFLEKVYENALAHEIRKAGLKAVQQHPVKVVYSTPQSCFQSLSASCATPSGWVSIRG